MDLGELVVRQNEDEYLSQIKSYLQDGTLPSEEKRARRLVLERDRFTMFDGILYYVDPGPQHQLKKAVPESLKQRLMDELHSGPFGGHFTGRGFYRVLAQHYWWDGMFSDATQHCRSCLTCAAYQGSGRKAKPPLQPIPVGGPFERVAVDVLEMPLTTQGNQYIVVFCDYLSKWVEAYPVPDQTADTIARLLVESVVCRNGVPAELLSDRGANMLSSLMLSVCDLLGMKKINPTSYYPQTDGLVENMNRTIRAMIAKYAHRFGPEWDLYLQLLLFAYRTKPHELTGETPFLLLYGRDAQLPTETALSQPVTPYPVEVEGYQAELVAGLAEATRIAQASIAKAQGIQKLQHDKKTRDLHLKVGDRVMVYMPHEAMGKLHKLALPYHGPYRVVDTTSNGVSIRPVDHPEEIPVLVNLERVTKCPDALPDLSWLGLHSRCRRRPPTLQK